MIDPILIKKNENTYEKKRHLEVKRLNIIKKKIANCLLCH